MGARGSAASTTLATDGSGRLYNFTRRAQGPWPRRAAPLPAGLARSGLCRVRVPVCRALWRIILNIRSGDPRPQAPISLYTEVRSNDKVNQHCTIQCNPTRARWANQSAKITNGGGANCPPSPARPRRRAQASAHPSFTRSSLTARQPARGGTQTAS